MPGRSAAHIREASDSGSSSGELRVPNLELVGLGWGYPSHGVQSAVEIEGGGGESEFWKLLER